MIVSIVNENQSHLNSHPVVLQSSTTAFFRDVEISQTRSDTDKLSIVNVGLGNIEQLKSSSNVAAKQV